jgi:hypothetical protein
MKINSTIQPVTPINTDNLIARMQKEDKRNKRIMKGMFFIYLAFSIIYLYMFVINPDPLLSFTYRISGLCFVLAFVVGTLFFWKRYKKFKNLDYTLPLAQLLEKTAERYKFWGTKWIPVYIVVVLVNIGFTMSYYESYQHWDASPFIKIIVLQAIYWGIMSVGGFIGYLRWRRHSMPIWKGAKTLLEELKN